MNPDERTQWLERIKAAVLAVEPTATVMLYGSRARGDARPDSDWDFLILLDGKVDYAREREVRLKLYPMEWETGEVINAIVHSWEDWESEPIRWTPFRENIDREGVSI
ncbi:MAG TPA: nucleotidyltransferase domain-containing protein [Rhodothermales bacterium]|nr:nucleotidyltransferase domain-containing protein [Rhodothermales bacterium]